MEGRLQHGLPDRQPAGSVPEWDGSRLWYGGNHSLVFPQWVTDAINTAGGCETKLSVTCRMCGDDLDADIDDWDDEEEV